MKLSIALLTSLIPLVYCTTIQLDPAETCAAAKAMFNTKDKADGLVTKSNCEKYKDAAATAAKDAAEAVAATAAAAAAKDATAAATAAAATAKAAAEAEAATAAAEAAKAATAAQTAAVESAEAAGKGTLETDGSPKQFIGVQYPSPRIDFVGDTAATAGTLKVRTDPAWKIKSSSPDDEVMTIVMKKNQFHDGSGNKMSMPNFFCGIWCKDISYEKVENDEIVDDTTDLDTDDHYGCTPDQTDANGAALQTSHSIYTSPPTSTARGWPTACNPVGVTTLPSVKLSSTDKYEGISGDINLYGTDGNTKVDIDPVWQVKASNAGVTKVYMKKNQFHDGSGIKMSMPKFFCGIWCKDIKYLSSPGVLDTTTTTLDTDDHYGCTPNQVDGSGNALAESDTIYKSAPTSSTTGWPTACNPAPAPVTQ